MDYDATRACGQSSDLPALVKVPKWGRALIRELTVIREKLDTTEAALTSDGRRPNCARKRLLKWDELPNPME